MRRRGASLETAMPRKLPSTLLRFALAFAAACGLPLGMAGCVSGPAPTPAVEHAPRLQLLGEVHDNAEGHRQRLQLVRAYVDAGGRPVIAMEQFDRERQADLDAAMARCADAGCVIEAATPDKAGWNWEYYAPVIQLALDHDLVLLAANLSRERASEVVKGGFDAALPAELLTAYGLDQSLPEALLSAQVEAVREGHCGMLPESLLEPMARAQVARDVVMADTMLDALAGTGDRVFLLAGNGHVKRGIAVPWWLHASGERSLAIGYLEQGTDDDANSRFDAVHLVPPTEREDPCAAFEAPRPTGS